MGKWIIASLFAAGLLVVGLTPSPTHADNCIVRNKAVYGYQTVNYGYNYQKAVVAPYAGYSQAYYVPKVVEVVVNPDYYYSVGSYYKDKLLADSIVGRILEAQRNGQIGGNPNAAGGGGAPPPPAVTPPVGPNTVKAGAYQEPKLLASVTNNCARCHSAGVAKGGLVLVTDDGKLADLSSLMAERVFRATATGTMPKGGNPVPDAEIPLYNQWADEVAKTASK